MSLKVHVVLHTRAASCSSASSRTRPCALRAATWRRIKTRSSWTSATATYAVISDWLRILLPLGCSLSGVVFVQCATILGTNFGRKNVSFDFQYDHCFWFGDLNYRVDMNYTTPRERTHEQHVDEVLALVKARKWTALNRNDQLKHQVEGKKALAGWELPPAQFAPTFKRVRHVESEYNVSVGAI